MPGILTAPLDSGLRRNDEVPCRHDEVGRRPLGANRGAGLEAGLASDALEALPHSSPPLWIPAFAGMTKWGAGMTKWGAGMTKWGAGGPALLGGRLGLRCARQTKSWYKSLQVGLFASISLIFQALFHSLSAFSLLIALSMVS